MTGAGGLLRRVRPQDVGRQLRPAVDPEVEREARGIVEQVRAGGVEALRAFAVRFGEIERDGPLTLDRGACVAALDRIERARREVLERTADRIRVFADAQRAALRTVEVAIPGGVAGHRIDAVERAGCYAPGGRFPLPSSVLMTAVTARAAGVAEVWVASPRPTDETLAAAAVAGVDGLLAVGGAHAIAALAHGVGGVPRCDLLAGPGNAWVTAAKKIVSGSVGIDLLAGPSELVVLTDDSADADTVAADLLAQAEHDVEALPVLVTVSTTLADAVDVALADRLGRLATASTARVALANGYTVVATSIEQAIEVVDRLAPEHLEIHARDADAIASRCRQFGAVFIGGDCAEVVGDYGAGPNHTLPTGGGARFTGGLSVLAFLRVRTWMRIDRPREADGLYRDAAELAAMEGLDGHRQSALRRLVVGPDRGRSGA